MGDQTATGEESARGVRDRATSNRSTRPRLAAAGKTPKAKPATPPAPRSQVTDVRLHFYLPIPYGASHVVKFLDFDWENTGLGGLFTFRGISLTLLTNANKGIADFKESVARAGTIVVYMGHTNLVAVKGKKDTFVAQGIQPVLGKTTVYNRALVTTLEKAKANIVVLAGCATSASVKAKLKNDVIVITMASGQDGKTKSTYWAQALTTFLLALVGFEISGKKVIARPNGPATVREAMDAGNVHFPPGESFVLASGDGSVREF